MGSTLMLFKKEHKGIHENERVYNYTSKSRKLTQSLPSFNKYQRKYREKELESLTKLKTSN